MVGGHNLGVVCDHIKYCSTPFPTSKPYQHSVQSPAEMNWASRRMYNTHKTAFYNYGLILGICELRNSCPWSKQWVYRSIHNSFLFQVIAFFNSHHISFTSTITKVLILISKSSLQRIDGCISINPGRLTKKASGGTYAKIYVPDIPAVKDDFSSDIGVQIVYI